MSKDKDDVVPLAELTGAAQQPRRSRRVRVGVGLVVLISFAVALVVVGVVALSGAYPALSPFFTRSTGPRVLAEATVRVAGDVTLPAGQAVSELVRHTPAGFTGTEVDVPAQRLVALAGTECAKHRIVPVVSASRAWASGTGDSRGLVLTVSAFGPGEGGAALAQVSDAGCGDTFGTKVDGADSIGVRTKRPTGRLTTLHLRRGDVVVSMSATAMSLPGAAPDDVAATMTSKLDGVCTDLGSGRADSVRNPYVDPDRFTGLVEDLAVGPGAPLPDPVVKADLPDLAHVDRPDKPDFPYWPTALPKRPDRPSEPSVPDPVLDSVTIRIHSEDTDGPGCGWAFTRTAPPLFDADVAGQAQRRDTSAAQRRMADDGVRYAREASVYTAAVTKYEADATTWNRYADKVGKIAVQWGAQRAAQQDYYARLAAWQRSVRVHDAFLDAQARARSSYDEQVSVCASPDSVPVPEPVPTPESGQTAVPVPEPTVEPNPDCPAQRPGILDDEAPTIPAKPTPPPDPRPKGSR